MTQYLPLTERRDKEQVPGRRKAVSRLLGVGVVAAAEGARASTLIPDSGTASASFPTQPSGIVRQAYLSLAEDMANPERGLIEWAGDLLENGRREWLDQLVATADSNFSMVRWSTNLGLHGYLDSSTIPDKALHRLSDNLMHVRRYGLKAVVRFMYSFPIGSQDYRNPAHPPLERMLSHIKQLGLVLQAHRGLIAFADAGFIGPWGEWHSTNLLDTPGPRTRIKDQLLAWFPGTVLFRLPRHVREWYGDSILSEDGGSEEGRRIGLHNDSILSLQIHNGNTWRTANFHGSNTLANEADDRLYARRLSRYRPYGGEVAPDDPAPYILKMSDPAEHATQDLRLHHFQFLNTGRGLNDLRTIFDARDPLFFSTWIRQLGYRFVLIEASCDKTIEPHQPFRLNLTLRNEGASRIMHRRPLQIRFLPVSPEGNAKGAPYDLVLTAVQPWNWAPSLARDHFIIESTLISPASLLALPSGDYKLGLRIPDPDPKLAGDSRYNVRLANRSNASGATGDPAHGWDAATGTFMLGLRVHVS